MYMGLSGMLEKVGIMENPCIPSSLKNLAKFLAEVKEETPFVISGTGKYL